MAKGRVLIIGGGTMGRGIAALCALSGYDTRVFEADGRARAALAPAVESSWSRAVERGKLAPEAAEQARGLLRIVEAPAESPNVEFVIEAVPESLELKRQIFAELDRLCADSAVLASNTSSLSIAAIGSATHRPDRVIGIHFFNPVAAMPLIEIVRAPDTSAATEESTIRFARSLGKQPIRVRDSPGFATSRLGVALGLEAMRMLEEGVATAEDIDRAMELGYGHRMGPLKTSDLVGLDVRLSIAETLASELAQERFRPPEILRRLVARGKTGKKSGEGFYRWDGDVARDAAPKENEE